MVVFYGNAAASWCLTGEHELSALAVVSQVDSEYKVRKMAELKCCVLLPWECSQKNFRTGESMLQKGGLKICVSVLRSTEKSHTGNPAVWLCWQRDDLAGDACYSESFLPVIGWDFMVFFSCECFCYNLAGLLAFYAWTWYFYPSLKSFIFFFSPSSHSHVSTLLALVRLFFPCV